MRDHPRGLGHGVTRSPCSSPTASRPCSTPTASTCSSAAASSSRAATTSSSREKGLYYAMWRQQIGERRASGIARPAGPAGSPATPLGVAGAPSALARS